MQNRKITIKNRLKTKLETTQDTLVISSLRNKLENVDNEGKSHLKQLIKEKLSPVIAFSKIGIELEEREKEYLRNNGSDQVLIVLPEPIPREKLENVKEHLIEELMTLDDIAGEVELELKKKLKDEKLNINSMSQLFPKFGREQREGKKLKSWLIEKGFSVSPYGDISLPQKSQNPNCAQATSKPTSEKKNDTTTQNSYKKKIDKSTQNISDIPTQNSYKKKIDKSTQNTNIEKIDIPTQKTNIEKSENPTIHKTDSQVDITKSLENKLELFAIEIMNKIDTRFDEINATLNEHNLRFDEIDSKFDDLTSSFDHVYEISLSSWVSLLLQEEGVKNNENLKFRREVHYRSEEEVKFKKLEILDRDEWHFLCSLLKETEKSQLELSTPTLEFNLVQVDLPSKFVVEATLSNIKPSITILNAFFENNFTKNNPLLKLIQKLLQLERQACFMNEKDINLHVALCSPSFGNINQAQRNFILKTIFQSGLFQIATPTLFALFKKEKFLLLSW